MPKACYPALMDEFGLDGSAAEIEFPSSISSRRERPGSPEFLLGPAGRQALSSVWRNDSPSNPNLPV